MGNNIEQCGDPEAHRFHVLGCPKPKAAPAETARATDEQVSKSLGAEKIAARELHEIAKEVCCGYGINFQMEPDMDVTPNKGSVVWGLQQAFELGVAYTSIARGETAGEMTAVDICRELYDRFVMGGWQPEEAHDYVREILEAHAKQRVEQAERQWQSWGVVEVAVRNPSVAEYCKHWEGRVADLEREHGVDTALIERLDRERYAAESELREMQEALGRQLRWHRFRHEMCIEGCVCDVCNAERLLARKAGS